MISIELDSGSDAEAAGSLTLEAAQALGRLLDRCDEEGIRDISLRFPRFPAPDLEQRLKPFLARRFRFSAWFRTCPSAALADLFIPAGHHITVATTCCAGGDGLKSLLRDPAFGAGAPWQSSVWVALPALPGNLDAMLEGLEPRRGTSLTLGLAWASPEAGPSLIPALQEREWCALLLGMGAWGTRHGVRIDLACGLPQCLFSTEELGELALMKVRFPLASCAPRVVITLNGRARACPRLPAGGWVPLPDGVALSALGAELIGAAQFFTGFCGRPGEQSCRSLAVGACGGGCLANHATDWSRAGGTGVAT
jgi:hypothetical protein